MANLKLLFPKRLITRRTSSRICKTHKITDSNQLWQADIKYGYVAGTKQTAYILTIIDVFDKETVAHKSVLQCTGSVASEVLIKALYKRNLIDTEHNLILRTDNGTQFISKQFESSCLKYNVIHERIPVRSPNYNAYIESYHATLQREHLTGRMFMTFEEFQASIDDFNWRYNNKRLHGSIKNMTPHSFYLLKDSIFKDNLVISL